MAKQKTQRKLNPSMLKTNAYKPLLLTDQLVENPSTNLQPKSATKHKTATPARSAGRR